MVTRLADVLVRRFQTTFTEPPSWAWPFKPPIPLIGRRYRPARSILVYASAENLTWLNDRKIPRRFTTAAAWNRYRVRYEEAGRDGSPFFPDVGIQPASDGGLLAAALFVADRLGLPTAVRPRTFLEKIAVSNWCKFTIRSQTNSDYIGELRKLTASLPFIVGELAELRPAVVLVPNQIWRRPLLQAAMRGASPYTRFLPVPQFNPTVVNVHLRDSAVRARRLAGATVGTPLATWMAKLRGFREENAWRYIAFLEEAITSLLRTCDEMTVASHLLRLGRMV